MSEFLVVPKKELLTFLGRSMWKSNIDHGRNVVVNVHSSFLLLSGAGGYNINFTPEGHCECDGYKAVSITRNILPKNRVTEEVSRKKYTEYPFPF